MGFGSYDESEQQRSTESADVEDDGGVNVHEHDHHGEVSVDEDDTSTDDLIAQLAEIKARSDDEDDEDE
jgi:hypothetical protein